MKDNNLLSENEAQSNVFVAKLMRITSCAFILVFVLNLIGIFIVEQSIMTSAFVGGMIMLLLPTLVVSVLKKTGPLVKYICIICAVVFVSVLALTVTYHSVVVYAYPLAIASIYFDKKLSVLTGGLSIVLLSVAQIMAFKLATFPDNNFPDMRQLLIFCVAPRALEIMAMMAIFATLAGRTSKMLGSLMGAEAQKHMYDRMLQMKNKSAQVTEVITGSVATLSEFTQNTAEMNANIAALTTDVTQSSNQMFGNINEATEALQDISGNIRQLAQQSEQISSLSGSVWNLTSDNSAVIGKAIEEMREINAGTASSAETITQLNNMSKQIGSIVEVITNISTETNLLALNASIESARAGAAGKGFAVVAERIRALSQATKESVDNIDSIISGVLTSTSRAASTMEHNLSLTESGVKTMRNVEQSTTQVLQATDGMNSRIVTMAQLTSSVAESSERILTLIEAIRAISSSNLDSIGQTAAACNVENQRMGELTGMVNSISDLALELKQLVSLDD